MSALFHEGHLAWSWVAAAAYLTVLLVLSDYIWRTSRLGGKLVFLTTGFLGLMGTALLLA